MSLSAHDTAIRFTLFPKMLRTATNILMVFLRVPNRCDPAVASRLRSILTQECLRRLGMPGIQKTSAVL